MSHWKAVNVPVSVSARVSIASKQEALTDHEDSDRETVPEALEANVAVYS